MFDFEKLDVYNIAKEVAVDALKKMYSSNKIDAYFKDQWKRATLSMLLNLAEGTGRISDNDKKHFYTVARSSVFECTAIIDVMKSMDMITVNEFQEFYDKYESISKMLLAMFRSKNKND